MTLLESNTWDTAALARAYPVAFSHPNKQIVHRIAQGTTEPPGSVRVQRWGPRSPEVVPPPTQVPLGTVDGPFAYDDTDDPDTVVFYPNFADPELFGYWDGPLLAQDEHQVAEHPILGSIRQALVDEGRSARTLDDQGRPTPFTLEGIARQCAVDVTTGLYGNAFSRADPATVAAATRAIDPPTVSNLVAMASLCGGRGRYTSQQIDWILTAAHTAFCGARACAADRPLVIHTGFWGCGAFGGNHTLMALIQMVAAATAGLDRLIFHTFSAGGRSHLAAARRLLGALSDRLGDDPTDWVVAITGIGLSWGVSDGN